MTPALASIETTLARLIAFPTVSSEPTTEMAAYLADRLEDAGGRVRLTGDTGTGKVNLMTSFGPDAPHGGILLSGHMDVVPVDGQDWTRDPFVLSENDDLLYGRGTCDMKGFIAACVEFAESLKDRRLGQPLHLAFTHDEEVGCLGARALIPEMRAGGPVPDIVIVGEPTSMQVIEGHKGCHEYSMHLTGLAGHGSAPERGVNAVEYATLYAAHLLGLRDALAARAPAASPHDPPGTTLNIGRIAGGMAHNVIADRAEIDWEMRPVQPEDAEFVLAEMDRFVAEKLLPRMHAVAPEAAIERRTIGSWSSAAASSAPRCSIIWRNSAGPTSRLIERNVLTAGSSLARGGRLSRAQRRSQHRRAAGLHDRPAVRDREGIGQSIGMHMTGGLTLAGTPDRWEWLQSAYRTFQSIGIEDVPPRDAGGGGRALPDHVDPRHPRAACGPTARAISTPPAPSTPMPRPPRSAARGDRAQPRAGACTRPPRAGTVSPEKGTITCEHVVNAGGLWAKQVGRMAGIELPVSAAQPPLPDLRHDPRGRRARPELPMTVDLEGFTYMRQDQKGMLLGIYEIDHEHWMMDGAPWDYGIELQRRTPTGSSAN
jgi:acetylornithine deacetylase